MLAVKLHKKPHPWLGSGSHLVPIIKWDSGKLQIKRWHYLLTATKKTPWPNNQIHFLTLVQIPDDLLVKFVYDYSARSDTLRLGLVNPDEFRALKDWPDVVKQDIQQWWDAYYLEPSRRLIGSWELITAGGSQTGGLMSRQPEVILGKKLPDSCIKWTKDIRLLYNRKAKKGRAKSADDETE